ncbi:unnamed protein product [Rotaria sordida]|uniref:Uncharacterized protein n=1 Tax=Rotaria sordida TaxID=392033 RepID=A0A815VUL5_9BILA|nr:unnamed protein product [Rotaria sordida]CAF1535041.1 unnamed protein product [Rotaria sordida]
MNSSHSEVHIGKNPSELYEYSKNIRPPAYEMSLFKSIPVTSLSSSWDLDYSANCSNLLSGYIHINQNDSFKQDCFLSCSYLCLCVIHSHGTTKIFDEEYINWLKGDLLIISYQIQPLEHFTQDDTVFHYVHDGSLLKYL